MRVLMYVVGWMALGLLVATMGCATRGEAGMQERFDALYAQWQTHVKSPKVQMSSNPRAYTDCQPFKDMAALGKPALPLLIAKIREGDSSGWKESQFFLWRAVLEISGTDLSDPRTPGEQETARRYIRWWGERK